MGSCDTSCMWHSVMSDSRRYSFDLTACPPVCPNELGTGETDVLCFLKDHKLRAHAVGHYANSLETYSWKRVGGYDAEMIRSCVDALRDLECPFFRLNQEHLPPCNQSEYLCTYDASCRTITPPLVQAYVDAIHRVMAECCRLPRFVRFFDSEKSCFCWLFSDHAIVVKMVWKGKAYHVMTAFHPRQGSGIPFREQLRWMVRRVNIDSHAAQGWCTEASWGLIWEEPEAEPTKAESGKRNAISRKTARYVRGGSRSWRQYLDQED